MSKLLFTSSKTPHSIGYIGGGAKHIPLELWPKVPNSDAYQTHLFTLYSDFYLIMYSLVEIIISLFLFP